MIKSLPPGKELNFIVWRVMKIGRGFPSLDLFELTSGVQLAFMFH